MWQITIELYAEDCSNTNCNTHPSAFWCGRRPSESLRSCRSTQNYSSHVYLSACNKSRCFSSTCCFSYQSGSELFLEMLRSPGVKFKWLGNQTVKCGGIMQHQQCCPSTVSHSVKQSSLTYHLDGILNKYILMYIVCFSFLFFFFFFYKFWCQKANKRNLRLLHVTC